MVVRYNGCMIQWSKNAKGELSTVARTSPKSHAPGHTAISYNYHTLQAHRQPKLETVNDFAQDVHPARRPAHLTSAILTSISPSWYHSPIPRLFDPTTTSPTTSTFPPTVHDHSSHLSPNPALQPPKCSSSPSSKPSHNPPSPSSSKTTSASAAPSSPSTST